MNTSPRPFVFVLMPFDTKFDDVYLMAIKPACENAGAYAERVDEQIFQGSILDRIYNQIAKADLVIADMTDKNPNVFYEIGYAHALGKPTLLLTKDVDDIPFDLKHYPHVIYEGKLTFLKDEIDKRVKWHIDNPHSRLQQHSFITAQVNDISLENRPVIIINNHMWLRFNLNNTAQYEISKVSCQIGIITPKIIIRSYTKNESFNVISISETENIHLPGRTLTLLPGAWESVYMMFQSNDRLDEFECVLRVFLESGWRDFPFTILNNSIP